MFVRGIRLQLQRRLDHAVADRRQPARLAWRQDTLRFRRLRRRQDGLHRQRHVLLSGLPQATEDQARADSAGRRIDTITCNFALQCSLPTQLLTTRASANSSAILNASDASNAFKDWNIVHVPYCTGDLHVGNKVLDAFDSGVEGLFGGPQCLGQQKKTYLNGFENVKAAFQWAKANYPNVDELVIVGMSAGSLGAQALAAYTTDLWSVEANGVKYGVLADSYIGVLPENRPAGEVLGFYGSCSSDLKLPASVLAKCESKTLLLSELGSAMLQLVPSSYWLFINSLGDATQRLFFQLCKDGIAGYPFANMSSETDYFAEVTKIVDAYKAISSNISTFFVRGSQHVVLNGAAFCKTVSTDGEIVGSYLSQWLASISTSKPTPTPTPVRPAC